MARFHLFITIVFITVSTSIYGQYHPPVFNTGPVTKSVRIEKSLYKVFYKSNTELIEADFKGFGKYYLKVGSRKITPLTTDSVFRIYGLHKRDTLKGYTYENKWLFRTQTGVISSFSERPIPVIYAASYFKKDGVLKKDNLHFRNKVLKEWVKDSPKASALWRKQHRRYIGKVLISPLIFASLVTVSTIAGPDSPVGVASWLLSLPLAMIPQTLHRVESYRIVDAYNAERKLENKNNFFPE